MNKLQAFLERNLGTWSGMRVYHDIGKPTYIINTTTVVTSPELDSLDVVNFINNLRHEYGDLTPSAAFLISWNSYREGKPYTNGSILSVVHGDTLIRNKGYMCAEYTYCKATFPEEDGMTLTTRYNNSIFTERFVLLHAKARSRNTLQKSTDNKFERFGSYVELKS